MTRFEWLIWEALKLLVLSSLIGGFVLIVWK